MKRFTKEEVLKRFKGGLIVSCQVQHDDPVYSEDFVLKMAKAAEWAGAVGIRANSPEQIRLIKDNVDLPMIGLYKYGMTILMCLSRQLLKLQSRCGNRGRKLSLSTARIR